MAPRDSRHRETAMSARPGSLAGNTWAAVAVIVLAGMAAYSNSFCGAFVFDDAPSIADNESIRSLRRLDHILLPVKHLDYYRPVLNLSLALCYGVGRLDVRPYHAFNLGLHLAAALTLFGVVRRSLLLAPHVEHLHDAATSLAFVAALLWLLHPLQTESVTYVVQRCEAMFGLFSLLSLYCVLRGATSPARIWWWYGGAVAACALGMGSKEAMAVTPLLILLYDRIFLTSSAREAFRKRWGLYSALALTGGILVPMIVMPAMSQSERMAAAATVGEYARTQFGVVFHYLRLSIWPADLCLDYQWPVAQSFWEIVPPAAFLGLLLAAVLGSLRRWPKAGFLGASFFLTLAPSSSVVPIPDLAFEHRMYLPLAPLVVAVVLGAYVAGRTLVGTRLSRGRTARLSSLCLVAGTAGMLGILTYLRNDDYRSELRIWQDTAAKAPNNYRAHNNLGRALAQGGRSAEALAHYARALELNPEYVETNFNLGLLLVQLDRMDDAIPRLNQVLMVRPNDLEAHLNLGVALARRDRAEEAVAHYQKALQIDPRFAAAHNNLGNALLRLGRVDQAVVHYQAAVDIHADDAEYQHNLGVGLHQLGRDRDAVFHWQAALRLQPDQVPILVQIAWVRATSPDPSVRDGADAIALTERAMELSGNASVGLLDVLAAAYAQAGRFPDAVRTARQALTLVPTADAAHAEALQDRLHLYESGTAFRDARPAAADNPPRSGSAPDAAKGNGSVSAAGPAAFAHRSRRTRHPDRSRALGSSVRAVSDEPEAQVKVHRGGPFACASGLCGVVRAVDLRSLARDRESRWRADERGLCGADAPGRIPDVESQ